MESVAEELVKKIVEKIAKLKVGLPEDNCDITPVVSESSANFIQGLVEDAKAKHAKFHQVYSLFPKNQQVSPVPRTIYFFPTFPRIFCPCYHVYTELLCYFFQEWKRQDNLIYPLLIDNVTPDMRIAWEEPFGPVIPVIRIKTVEEGISHCNANNFALQVQISYFFCKITFSKRLTNSTETRKKLCKPHPLPSLGNLTSS
jgi:glyceraldehyde-3-phosphate dehydrogenase (NADP+)